jgi:hypothetical protein
MRIEINLTEEVATALQTKAEALNHSRKSYIEFLCIKEALAKKIKKKKITSTELPTKRKSSNGI